MGGRKGRSGGRRDGAGRKSKAEEMGLQSKLDPMEEDFLRALHDSIIERHPVALKLYADYRYGKPTDHVDVTTGGEKLEPARHEIIFKDYSKDAKS